MRQPGDVMMCARNPSSRSRQRRPSPTERASNVLHLCAAAHVQTAGAMKESKSPSGRFEITIAAWEARMSLWIETPTLSDRLTGQELLSFNDPHWSLDSAEWQSDSTV